MTNKIVQHKKKAPRPKTERTAFEAWVAKMVLSGYTQKSMSGLYKEEFGKEVSYAVVNNTIHTLRERWRDSALEDTGFHINVEIERLDVMEVKAWGHYRECGGTIQETEVKDLFGADGTKRESMTTIKTKDDPRLAMQWFDRILRIQKDRRKILKLETTININNILAVKAYAHFNPDKDWDEHPNVIQANVIDAEFTSRGEAE